MDISTLFPDKTIYFSLQCRFWSDLWHSYWIFMIKFKCKTIVLCFFILKTCVKNNLQTMHLRLWFQFFNTALQLKYFIHNHNRSICIVYSTLIKKMSAVNTKWIKSNRLYDKKNNRTKYAAFRLVVMQTIRSVGVSVCDVRTICWNVKSNNNASVYNWQSTNHIFIRLNDIFSLCIAQY